VGSPTRCASPVAQCLGAIAGVAMAKAVRCVRPCDHPPPPAVPLTHSPRPTHSPQAFTVMGGGANGLQTIKMWSPTLADTVTVNITAGQAVWGEIMGTALLVLAVLFCTDRARWVHTPRDGSHDVPLR
jgi:glycerol uptake facilitator-like aquaporin